MKQIILINTGVPASKQTLAQFIALSGSAWITNEIKKNSIQSTAYGYERLSVYKTIPAWANKGVEKKTLIGYCHNDLFNIAERAREQGRECFYVKRIDKLGHGIQFTEVPEEEVPLSYNVKFTLPKDIYSQYSEKYLAPTIYKIRSCLEMKYVMNNRVLYTGLLYEEDWIDFWYDGERIAVGFRPLCDGLADRITKGLELL